MAKVEAHSVGDQVEVHVAAGVAIGPVVDFVGVEGGVEGLGHPIHVGKEGAALRVGELRHVTGVLLIGHDAAAGVALLLEKHQHAGLQVADVDAEAVQQLLVPGAVSAGLIFHESTVPFWLDCLTIIARPPETWYREFQIFPPPALPPGQGGPCHRFLEKGPDPRPERPRLSAKMPL